MNEDIEKEIQDKISLEEAQLEKILREAAIKGIQISLAILKHAVKSQDPETIIKGWQCCHSIQEAMIVSRIECDEIKSSEKEIESLENEIIQKLPAPDFVIVIGETKEQKEED